MINCMLRRRSGGPWVAAVLAALTPVAVPAVALPLVVVSLVTVPLAVAARAGSLSGTARLRGPSALPPDAVFEAVLIDTALADAPARELGRFQLKPAKRAPFRFTIPYRESDLSPWGRYAVRASVRLCDQLIFSTDTHYPVLGKGSREPLQVELVRVAAATPVKGSGPGPLGCLPASWRGELPGGGGTSRWQVDLAADGSYQLRQTLLDRPAPNSFDDIGRWRLEPPGNRLALRGGREAPIWFEPLERGAALRQLDLDGRPMGRGRQAVLRRLAAAEPIDPRLLVLGLFRYMADAASLQLCATGARLPVAMEGDFLRLEKAYLAALRPGLAGQPLLVNLEGLITERASMEPWQAPRRTLVVQRFIGVHPGRSCPPRGW